MNSINLLGRLTKDPEIKTSGTGVTFCSLTLAVNKPGKKDEVDFFNCTAFNKTAEVVKQYCKKGQQLAVTGSMTSNKSEDKIYWSVVISSISLISTASNNQEQDNRRDNKKQDYVDNDGNKKKQQAQEDDIDDDIFPF